MKANAPTANAPKWKGARPGHLAAGREDFDASQAERVLYRLPKKYCPRCRRTFHQRAPAALPKSLYRNQRVATATTMYYLHGIPSGKVCEQTGMEPGSVVEIFYRLTRLFSGVPARLIEEYRQGSVKHADETGWRVNGHNGYTWLFATPCPLNSLYRWRRSLRPGGLTSQG